MLTPEASAHWDGETISFGPGVTQREAPSDDALETAWRTYYAATFNPARINHGHASAATGAILEGSAGIPRDCATHAGGARARGRGDRLASAHGRLADGRLLAGARASCRDLHRVRAAPVRHADRLWTWSVQRPHHAGRRTIRRSGKIGR
ncbi:hypothetical protein [Nitrospira defluvii]|uniref:hypothetical protein n=1 Tax=Nitrospira defluvii TaxID=330214 RepID=UPI003CCE7996